MSAGVRAMTDRPTEATPRPWRCLRCGRTLGHLINGVLHEERGDKSGTPLVRRCKGCGKRNVKLAA